MYRSGPNVEATALDLGVRVYRAVLNLTTLAPLAPWRFKNFGLGLGMLAFARLLKKAQAQRGAALFLVRRLALGA